MLSFLSSKRIRIIFCILAVSGLTCGCGENPSRAAAKKAHAAVDAAVAKFAATGDFDAAQKTLRQAMVGVPAGTAGQEVVLLLEGSLKYGQAGKIVENFLPLRSSTEQNLKELAKIAQQIAKTQVEKVQIEANLRSRQEALRQLKVRLDGDANTQGLNAQLEDVKAKLSPLKSQQSQLEHNLSEKLRQAAEIQRQADELLAKAELTEGAQKGQLQKEAYNILLGSKDSPGKAAYLSEAQQFQDELSTVESEIALLEPKVETFGGQIAKIRQRIDELNKSDFAAKSNERLTAINSSLTQFQEKFAGALDRLAQTQSSVAEKIKQMTELLSASQKDFKKTTSDESLKDFGRLAAAEADFTAGRTEGEYALAQRQLAARLTILTSSEVADSQTQLKTLAQRYVDDSDEYVAKAMTDYNDASDLLAKIPVRREEFGIAVLKKHLLVLAQKAYLADRIENTNVKADTIREAKELIDKGVKLDPTFEASLTEPPYNILAGQPAVEAAVPSTAAPAPGEMEKPKAAVPKGVVEPNQPIEEPNFLGAEGNLPAAEQNQEPLKETARQVVTLISEGKFEDATAFFDDNMKKSLPAQAIEELWKQLESVGGPFTGFGESRVEKIMGFDTVFVPATWEKNKLDFKVVFDKQGRVTGLWTEKPK